MVQIPERERQVLLAMHEGLDGRQTARSMNLSLLTIRGYQASLRRRFGVRSQLALLAEARRAGVLPCACEKGV